MICAFASISVFVFAFAFAFAFAVTETIGKEIFFGVFVRTKSRNDRVRSRGERY